MAAADVPGATKGLLLIFTLFTLVHVTNSLEATEHLEILTKYLEGGLNEAAKKKAQLDDELTRFVDDFQEDVDKIALVVKRLRVITQKNSYLRKLPRAIDKYLSKKIQKANDEVEAHRKEMQDVWAFIDGIENNRGEL